jgi:hypothetical protein
MARDVIVFDMRNWLAKQWQDISGNFKFAVLLLLGTGVMSAVTALTNGLFLWQKVALVALFAVIFGWALIATVQANRPKSGAVIITPENVESYVRQWLDNFNVAVQKLPKSEKFHFNYKVDYKDRTHLHILHPKERSHYLTILAHFTMPKGYKDLFDRLPEPEKKRFLIGIRTEVSRARIRCGWKSFFEKINIEKLLPITTLTEGDLIEQLDGVHASQLLVMDTIILRLEQEGKPPTDQASSTTSSSIDQTRSAIPASMAGHDS